MNKKLTSGKTLSGRLRVPADKSLTHRAVLLSSLAKGTSQIQNPLAGEDCLSSCKVIQAMGCKVSQSPKEWTVEGSGLWGFSKPVKALDCGNSGTTMRLISGIMAAQKFDSELIGDASLSSRPMDRVARPLREMGGELVLTNDRFPPLKIKGSKSLKGMEWNSPVSSAQVKSCVLLASLHAKGKTIYTEPTLSRDHTERMLQACGVNISREGTTTVLNGPSELKPQKWVIPGDFSSAAFFLAAGLLVEDSEIVLESVNLNPTRTGLLVALKEMGASIHIDSWEEGGEPVGDITVRGKANLHAIDLDPALSAQLIDEVPILAVLATQAKGKTRLRGLAELRVKETDRLRAMAENLTAMGALVEEEQDGLIIEGPAKLKGALVDSFEDHRIAMSMAVAALVADGETTIQNGSCVAISYPSFWDDLSNVSRR